MTHKNLKSISELPHQTNTKKGGKKKGKRNIKGEKSPIKKESRKSGSPFSKKRKTRGKTPKRGGGGDG